MDQRIREIAERIKELREIMGISEVEMAEQTSTTLSEYRALESGETDFQIMCILVFHTGRKRDDRHSICTGDTRRTNDIKQAVPIHTRHLYIGYDRVERTITQNIDHGKRI